MSIKSAAVRLGEILQERGLSVAAAESCTGGLICAAITAVPGASSYFRGGIIAYDNAVKRDLLGVSAADLENHGAVSEPVVRAMAAGAAKLLKGDCAISVSGIAGPDGGTEVKPVGLVYIGVYYNGDTNSRSFIFSGSREDVRKQSAAAAIDLLIETLSSTLQP